MMNRIRAGSGDKAMTTSNNDRLFSIDTGMLVGGAVHFVLFLLLVLMLTGCGGGAQTTENPVTGGVSPSSYSGPPPATSDVQAFRINVWENLKADNRCGAWMPGT